MRERRTWLHAILLIGLASVAAAPGALACDDAARAQFLADVAAGLSVDELQAAYSHCRDANTADTLGKLIQITNTGSVFYEEMNGCGYNPQTEEISCDVEVKRNSWYGPFPSGSQEYVLWCFACGNPAFPPTAFNAQFLGTVHVTNDAGSGGIAPFFFQASTRTWSAPPACTANTGTAMSVRAILSWAVPPTSCNFVPIWGNQIDFTVRTDP